MNDVEIAFEELFFGSGSWLGLLLMITIIVALTLRAKWAGLIAIPITVFMAVDYLDNSMMWNALIILLTNIFIIINMAKHDD